jgi:putative Mg2+ transporter-C (MgtC) family protein
MWDRLFDPLALDILVKLGIGALLGAVIGWEREARGHPAGIRTHMLLVVGVILFTEVSRAIGGEPGRIAAQVVTGIGFLCAGAILRVGLDVKGLTTAASLWAASAIGMAVSLGGPFITVAVVATVLTLVTLVTLRKLAARFMASQKTRVLELQMDDRGVLYLVLEQLLTTKNTHIHGFDFVESSPDYTCRIELRSSEDILHRCLAVNGLKRANWVD